MADAPLAVRLPAPGASTEDELLGLFLGFVKAQGLELYAAQEEALLELLAHKNVILGTPTGSGKSMVALAAHFLAMAEGKRSIYTAPIKALVSEKFFALCRDFGPDNVGMMTGDATVNREAPILCATAEVLANMALREGEKLEAGYIVVDEFHYYADRDRGSAWQLPLLVLEQSTFLLMSATIGPTRAFEEALTRLNGRQTAVVRSGARPVPLDFEYRETPLHLTILDLVKDGRAPIYVVAFTQRGAAEEAQNLMSVDYTPKDDKRAIHAALEHFRWDTPYGKDMQRFVRHGVGLHHAGLLPKYRLLVEKLAQRGLLKVICGTDTLGVGVNIPIRTVLLTKLCKYDGEKTRILSVREFMQISGRAGRKGFDDRGSVVAQAPEHVIENLRLEGKALTDPSKKKFVRKKPPEKGYVHYDRSTFDRLVSSEPEPLESRFQVTHGMILNVLERPGGGCLPFARILRDSHEAAHQKKVHARTAKMMLRSLVDSGIVEGREGKLVVSAELQEDFSLNQTLSLYLLDALPLVQKESETYALDLLTLVESILEDPDIVLMKQLDRLKALKLAELKAAGVEYEERIAELEKLEYPKPNRDFIYGTFNAFATKHPWVGAENIRPKSVAREMFETYQAFAEYVKEYGLERTEGLLLRYLSDVYKTLVQTVPARAKTPEVDEIELYFGTIVRAVDSSLLDEWERMRRPEEELARPARRDSEDVADLVLDARAFTVLVRNAVFAFVRALARGDWTRGAELLEDASWTPVRLEQAMRDYLAEHGAVRVDAEARAPANTQVEPGPSAWRVRQELLDAEGRTGWSLEITIDLERSRERGRPALTLERVGSS